MSRAQIEIDIPDGYELVKVREQAHRFFDDELADCRLLVSLIVGVRPVWQWPAWLKCDWVARNQNGSLVLGYGEHATDGQYHFSNAGGCHYSVVDERAVDINLPPCTDWRQSLRLNPNREAK